MKTWRIVFSVIIGVGLLSMMAVPTVRADVSPPSEDFTFHVHENDNARLDPVPADAVETIEWEQTFTTTYGPYVILENLCTGTNCAAQDIYYRITIDFSWYYSWVWPPGSVYTPPHMDLSYGSATSPLAESITCGEASSANSGTCAYELAGTILAAQIDPTPGNHHHEKLAINLHSDYGGALKNTGHYTAAFSTSPILGADCSGQYLVGSQIGTVTIAATNSTGVNLLTVLKTNYPKAGEYFMLEVVAGNHWHNNGTVTELRSLGMKYGPAGFITLVGDANTTECKDPTADKYFIQMLGASGSLYLSVYDIDGVWVSNTGQLVVNIYNITARTRYLSGCELLYDVGAFVEQKTVQASWTNGQWINSKQVKVPSWPSAVGGEGQPTAYRYYMLETFGGPANLGAGYMSYDADMGQRPFAGGVPSVWEYIGTASFVSCAVQTDMVGHWKVFFAIGQVHLQEFLENYFYIRVRDTGSYADNSGSLSYKLYQASYIQTTTPGYTPTASGCDAFDYEGTPTGSVTIPAVNSTGVALPPMGSTQTIYALITSAGPWLDSGIASYAVQLSSNDGTTWYDMHSYPELLCSSSSDGYHIKIFVYGVPGQIWRARVKDSTGNFGNNTGSIDLTVYPGSTTATMWPTCHNDYANTSVPLSDLDRMVDAHASAGVDVPTIVQGQLYSIEIADVWKWYEAGTGSGSYLVDISHDGGSTWTPLEIYGETLCSEQIGTSGRFQIWFTAESNEYRLRVRDADGNWNTNTGSVMYNLYTTYETDDPPVPPGTDPPIYPPGTPPPEWVVACNEAYQRPTAFIEQYELGTFAGVTLSLPVPMVAEWLDYIRNAITYFFAWCPEHTTALQNIGQSYDDREPLASIRTLMEFVSDTRDMITSATGGAESETLVSQEPDLFADAALIGQAAGGNTLKNVDTRGWNLFLVGNLDPETNIWAGGKVDFTASIGDYDASEDTAYVTLCSSKFSDLFGITSTPMCQFLSALRTNQIVTILLLAIDFIMVIWFFLSYIPRLMRRYINVMNKNSGGISKAASGL